MEERDGYWVLKEKFREGINPQEKVKIEKDPMKLFIEDGINELAGLSFEEIDKPKHTKDDIDVRLKWLGLFHRRKHQCKLIFYSILPVFVQCSFSLGFASVESVETSFLDFASVVCLVSEKMQGNKRT